MCEVKMSVVDSSTFEDSPLRALSTSEEFLSELQFRDAFRYLCGGKMPCALSEREIQYRQLWCPRCHIWCPRINDGSPQINDWRKEWNNEVRCFVCGVKRERDPAPVNRRVRRH
jgi:hypothetical protein